LGPTPGSSILSDDGEKYEEAFVVGDDGRWPVNVSLRGIFGSVIVGHRVLY
jgi:hypothetical protein